MELQFPQVKIFLAAGASYRLEDVRATFTRWIQQEALPELLIDVADYSHMHQGPGVVLVGHEANWSLDEGEGRPGLLYGVKQQRPGSARAVLIHVFRRVLEGCVLLETSLPGLRFDPRRARVTLNDRLGGDGGEAAYRALEAELRSFLAVLHGPVPLRLDRERDAKRRMAVEVAAELAAIPAPNALLGKLAS